MAGIGFELRRLFRKENLFSKLKGVAFATFVSAGPMIVSILMIILISQVLKSFGVTLADRELVVSAIMYDYVFAMILTSGFAMVLSRYLADQFYLNDSSNVLASLVGILALTTGLGALVGIIFYINSPLPFYVKFPAYLLFIELISLYMLMVYLSALKNYQKITGSFIIGGVIAIVLTVLAISLGFSPVPSALLSVTIGYLVINVILTIAIRQHFTLQSGQIFQSLTYLTRMPKLFAINLAYTLAIFIPNILFWRLSSIRTVVGETFFIAPDYDTATFFAVLTIIPATVLFVVKVETSFYDHYRKFCQTTIDGASLRDIRMAKASLIDVTRRELTFIFEVQFILTVVFIIFGVNIFLPMMGSSQLTNDLFVILAIGYYLTFMTFIVITLLLYFDNQTDSMKSTLVFLVLSTGITWVSLAAGEEYYGLGLAISALITLLISLSYLSGTVEKIDYRMFSLQPDSVPNSPREQEI